jgi:TPR repeat protein
LHVSALLVLATIAQLLADPPVAYTSEMTPAARAAYEEHRDDPPAELLAALGTLADRGDLSAAEFLGEIYHFGLFGVTRDDPQACDLFERAAPDRADAAHNLATCYFSGSGRPRDHVRAREWYLQAAQAGWTNANCALGNMLVRGEGGEREPETGVALCRLAAERGDRDAQTDLGGYLLVGTGAARDPIAARGYLESAARQGQVNAAYLLGQVYSRGDGVALDRGAARQWFEVAHEGGRPDAAYRILQLILAEMVDRSGPQPIVDRTRLPDAINWAEIAAAHEPDAERKREAAEFLASLRRSSGEAGE